MVRSEPFNFTFMIKKTENITWRAILLGVVIAAAQCVPRCSNGNGVDDAISHDDGDFLQRRLYPLPRCGI